MPVPFQVGHSDRCYLWRFYSRRLRWSAPGDEELSNLAIVVTAPWSVPPASSLGARLDAATVR